MPKLLGTTTQGDRFGKFVELQFDKNGRISGAAVRTYLLERSRVCQVQILKETIIAFTFSVQRHLRREFFRVVAAILHLGNIDFAKGEEVDSSVIKDEKSRFHLNTTAELLRCDAKSLEDALIKRVMVTPEEVITRTLDRGSAAGSRDALAKTIYSRLFDWLVDKINSSIGQDPNSKSLIGVLDIYGFESFKFNR
ncbi:hypothetical protein Pint_11199 [Pistacia integerrima]|uniref:Uncharacterized protein n=1 Tax=Pistacia integerrima TaxID=434235 RepID=A0ACC0XND2_9ROSI|nr:hypothetical protein Pint_11199 [Pistacia integerrima]